MNQLGSLENIQRELEFKKAVRESNACLDASCNGPWIMPDDDWKPRGCVEHDPRAMQCPAHGSSVCHIWPARELQRARDFCQRIGHTEFVDAMIKPHKTGALVRLAEKNGRCIVISGLTGRGKDFAIAYRLWRRKKRPHWITASQLVRDMAQGGNKLRGLRGATFVIEDLGAESERAVYGQGETAALITEAFDILWGSECELLISTNLDRARFAERYGARLVSRMQLADWIELPNNEPDNRSQPK